METSESRYGEGFGAERMWGLQELPLPEPIPFTPETWGWAGVAAACVLLALAGVWLWRRRARRRRALRTTVSRVEAMRGDPAIRSELPGLLRASALRVAPREEVASLRGDAWIGWLNRTAGREVFRPSDASALDALAYGPPGRGDPDVHGRLVEASLVWLGRQRA